MPGIVGQFFRQFGVTISVAVLISLFVSFTVDPMLSARLVKAHKPGEERKENAPSRCCGAGSRAWSARTSGSWVGCWITSWSRSGWWRSRSRARFVAAKKVGAEFMSAEDHAAVLIADSTLAI